jgi:hypothetical protein
MALTSSYSDCWLYVTAGATTPAGDITISLPRINYSSAGFKAKIRKVAGAAGKVLITVVGTGSIAPGAVSHIDLTAIDDWAELSGTATGWYLGANKIT